MLTVPSGAEVVISVAPFLDAMALKNAIAKDLSQSDIKIDLKSLSLTKQVDVGQLVRMALTVDSSPAVQAAMWKCLARCLYNGEKITPDTFDEEWSRQDYYPIVAECLTVNLRDFFKPLVSKFFGLLAKLPQEAPPSK